MPAGATGDSTLTLTAPIAIASAGKAEEVSLTYSHLAIDFCFIWDDKAVCTIPKKLKLSALLYGKSLGNGTLQGATCGNNLAK